MTNIKKNIFIDINKNIYRRSICTNILLLYYIIFVFLISSLVLYVSMIRSQYTLISSHFQFDSVSSSFESFSSSREIKIRYTRSSRPTFTVLRYILFLCFSFFILSLKTSKVRISIAILRHKELNNHSRLDTYLFAYIKMSFRLE